MCKHHGLTLPEREDVLLTDFKTWMQHETSFELSDWIGEEHPPHSPPNHRMQLLGLMASFFAEAPDWLKPVTGWLETHNGEANDEHWVSLSWFFQHDNHHRLFEFSYDGDSEGPHWVELYLLNDRLLTEELVKLALDQMHYDLWFALFDAQQQAARLFYPFIRDMLHGAGWQPPLPDHIYQQVCGIDEADDVESVAWEHLLAAADAVLTTVDTTELQPAALGAVHRLRNAVTEVREQQDA